MYLSDLIKVKFRKSILCYKSIVYIHTKWPNNSVLQKRSAFLSYACTYNMIFNAIFKGCYLTTESTIPLQLWSKGLRCLLPVESTGCHLTCRGLVKSNRQKNAPQRPDI